MMSLRSAIEQQQIMAEVVLALRTKGADEAERRFAASWDAGRVPQAMVAGFELGAAVSHLGEATAGLGLWSANPPLVVTGVVDYGAGAFLALAFPVATVAILGPAVGIGNVYQMLRASR